MKTIATYFQQLLVLFWDLKLRDDIFLEGDISNFNKKRLKEPHFLWLMFATSVLFTIRFNSLVAAKIYF